VKIITIGMSPYNTTSVSKLHADILKHLLLQGHSLMSLSWAHDISYYVPVDGQYYYNCEIDKNLPDQPTSPQEYKIPIMPLLKGLNDPIPIYEAISNLEPELVITIGEIAEAAFIKAVKTFVSKPFKWLSILTQSQYPISDELSELTEYMDGVLCVSPSAYHEISKIFHKSDIACQYVGADQRFFRIHSPDPNKFRLMTLGKSSQLDNLATVMQVCSELRDIIPELELYVHANVCDTGEYNLNLIKNRYDPEDKFIYFPDKFVSLVEGVSSDELAQEYIKSDIFISIPLASGTSMSVFEAIASGCFPIMSCCGSNKDLASELADHGISLESLTVPGIDLLTIGETWLKITNPVDLKNIILDLYKNRKKLEGYKGELIVFAQNNNRRAFMNVLSKMICSLENSIEVLCLETM
jgi:hypothetical protein